MLKSNRDDFKKGAQKPPSFDFSEPDFSTSLQRVRDKAQSYVSDLGLNEETRDVLFSGKMLRSHLSFAAGVSLRAQNSLVEAVACSVEMVHEASLCHDDIQDGQLERRQRPTLWKAVGINQAINFGDLLTSLSYRPLLELKAFNSHLLVNHLNQVIGEVIRGQILEQQNLGKPISRAFYERIATLKTGALISAGPQLICLGMGQTLAMQSVTMAFQHLSLAFQILNDLSTSSDEGLELDFRNRVFSFPFILLQDHLHRRGMNSDLFASIPDYQKARELMLTFSIREEVQHLGLAHLRLFRERIRQLGDDWACLFEPLLKRHFEARLSQ